MTWIQEDLDIKGARIMLVDDEPVVLRMLRRYLQNFGCENVVICSDSTKALDLIRKMKPDILMLDLLMPNMSGLDVLQSIRKDDVLKMLPVLVMTASTDPETKILALLGGATDYVQKPLEMTDVLPRVRNALVVKKQQDEVKEHVQCLRQQAEDLENQVEMRTAELIDAWDEAFECLATAAEYRDDDTGQHVRRVGRYVALIAKQLELPASDIKVLEPAAQLHDVGKIGVPDTILLKPGKLTDEEFDLVRKHCEFGTNILLHRQKHAPEGEEVTASPVMQMAAVIAESHHEWWDGSGYPHGLKGDQIPLPGRLTAVADVYDALSSKRPYKDAMPHEKCVEIIRSERGTHFDPAVLDAFMVCAEEIRNVRRRLSDSEDASAS